MNSATTIAERLRIAIQELSLNEDEGSARITVSKGVSAWRSGETTWGAMLHRADKALYRAKREGRNRVMQHCDELMLMDIETRATDLRTGTNG